MTLLRVFAVALVAVITLAGSPLRADVPPPPDWNAARPQREVGARQHKGGRARPRRAPVTEEDRRRWHDPITERGQRARGIYLGASFIRQNGADAVVRLVRSSHMDAVVLDLKDAEGRVHYDTAIPELEHTETGWLGDTAALVRTLRENDVYTIARVVCFADRMLPQQAPERAIMDTRERRGIWRSWGTGGTWLDPYNEANHRLVVALAREAQALGFDEVQLDYVRFPVDEGLRYARFPSETEERHADVLMRLLRAVDEAITIPLGVDVFGLAAYRRGNPSRLGQDLERWTQHVEVFSPMLYINAMREWNVGEANRAYSLVHAGIARLRERIGPRPVIRPFLQAFERGSGGDFGPHFISQQVRAVHQARGDGVLWWHPGHNYSMVRRGLAGRGRALLRFPLRDEVIATRSSATPPPLERRRRRR